MIHFFKLKADKAVLSLAQAITVRYNETKNRTAMTVLQHLTDIGYCTEGGEYADVVRQVIAEEEEVTVESESNAMEVVVPSQIEDAASSAEMALFEEI